MQTILERQKIIKKIIYMYILTEQGPNQPSLTKYP